MSAVVTGVPTSPRSPVGGPLGHRPAAAVWVAVCRLADLLPERGAAALVDDEQVALFRLLDGSVLAVQQQDPVTGAHVLSRGIVGTRATTPTVTSPLHKEVYDLRTGARLDAPDGTALRTFAVRVENEVVLVRSPLARDGAPPQEHLVRSSQDAAAVTP